MEIVSRAAWGARAPTTNPVYTTWARRDLFLTHRTAGGRSQSVRSVQDWCMGVQKGHSDIDYNALVRDDGTIYEGRTGLWLVVASHALNTNTRSFGVAWLGNEGVPGLAALASIRWLYDECNRRRTAAGHGPLTHQVHSDYVQTGCPGTFLKAWDRAGMPAEPATGGGKSMVPLGFGDKGAQVTAMQLALLRVDPQCLPQFGADGGYGDETTAAVKATLGGVGGDGRVYGAKEHDLLMSLAYGSAGAELPTGSVKLRIPAFEVTASAVA